jgi:hypothetical protein
MEWIFSGIGVVLGWIGGATVSTFFTIKRERRQEAMRVFVQVEQVTTAVFAAAEELRKCKYDQSVLAGRQQFSVEVGQRSGISEKDCDDARSKIENAARNLRLQSIALRACNVNLKLLFGVHADALMRELRCLHASATSEDPLETGDLGKYADKVQSTVEQEVDRLWQTLDWFYWAKRFTNPEQQPD